MNPPLRPLLFLDEDMSAIVAARLRKSGFDVLTTHQAGRCASDDESQLRFAADQGRVLITRNYADFQQLHARCLLENRHHCGIIVCFWRPNAEVILQRLLAVLNGQPSDRWRDQLLFA